MPVILPHIESQTGTKTITVGPSPFTYTAGDQPEMVYINGVITGVSKAGLAIGTSTIWLNAGESITVGYLTKPIMTADLLSLN